MTPQNMRVKNSRKQTTKHPRKSLYIVKNTKIMRFESRRGQNEVLKKKHLLQSEKKNYSNLLASPLALHFKDDLQSLKRCSYITQNG